MQNLKILTVIFVLVIFGCQKDSNLETEKNPPSDTIVQSGLLSLADAQSYYEHHFSSSAQNGQIFSSLIGDDECVIVIPLWFLASEVLTFEGNSLVIVPLDIKEEEVLDGRGMQMVFYTNEFDEIETEVVLYEAEDYDETRPYPIDNSHFSGFLNAINVNTKTSRLFPVQDGEILGMVEVEPLQEDGFGGGIDDRNEEGLLSWLCKWFGIGCGGCPPASGNGPGWGWSNLWSTFTGFFPGSGGGGSEGGGGSSIFWLGYSYSGFPFYNYGNGGGSSGGGGSSANPFINTIFDGTFFNGEGQAVANKLEELVADYDMMVCAETLHQELYHCLALNYTGEPLPSTGSGNQGGPNLPNYNPSELNISGYIYELNRLLNGASTECLTQVVSQYQTNIDLSEGDGILMCAIQDNNNFDIADADLFELVKEHCGSDGDCIDGLFECFNRLDNFQQEYNLILNGDILNQVVASSPASICDMGNNELEEAVLVLLANSKHDYLLSTYPNYYTANVNIQTFVSQQGAKAYLASAIMYETFMGEVGDAPDDPYQWQLAMEVFRDELLPILAEFTPGIGDLMGAYNDFNNGNYFWGCVGIISSIVPGDEIIKVIRKADNIRDAWKSVKALYRVWNNLFPLAGTQKVFNKLPQAWKDLPGSKLSNNNQGLKWNLNSGHHFRIAEANPSSQWSSQHVPYAKFFKNGSYRDLNMNPVSNQSAESHIPIDDLTDSFLDSFFN